MPFGGLLGSLYGDLPPPKSGSGVVDGLFLNKSDSTVASSVSASPTPKRDEPKSDIETGDSLNVSIPSESVQSESKLTTTTFQDEVLLASPSSSSAKSGALPVALLPPATRVRARPPTVDRPKLLAAEVLLKKTLIDQQISARFKSTVTPVQPKASPVAAAIPFSIEDEYDPKVPNSYDEYVKERARERRRQEEERSQKERADQLREQQKQTYATHVAPTESLDISGDEAWQRRRQLSAAIFGTPLQASPERAPGPPEEAPIAPQAKKKANFAQKMLEKMGWKEGEGLGRDKQGIVAPLVARKTDKRSGIIIHGGKNKAATTTTIKAEDLPNATRILLLTNMVGKGEVDAELEPETAEEGAKYGNLLEVKIVEVEHVPDDISVRIFCEYETADDALTAYQNFNNRLFGGRRVKARFYDETLYTQDALKEPLKE